MKKKNKIIIRIIASILFIAGFVLCGCGKNLPAAIHEQSSAREKNPSVKPVVEQHVVLPAIKPVADSLANNDQYPKGGYGSYTP